MHDSPKVSSFIALRANGWSLASIALEIDVPKSTLWEWDTKHQNQVLRLKQLQLEKLHQTFLPTYEEELSKLNRYLHRVEAALEDSDFDYMSPAYLLQMALQIRGRLARIQDQASVPGSQSNAPGHVIGCLTRTHRANSPMTISSSIPRRVHPIPKIKTGQNRTKHPGGSKTGL